MTNDGIILVTGGSRGIGAATAVMLAERGHRVVVVDIVPETPAGANASVLVWPESFDVAREESVTSGIAAIEDKYGPITGLVNAAGVFGKMHSLERIRMENWDREVNIDLRGTFLVARAVGDTGCSTISIAAGRKAISSVLISSFARSFSSAPRCFG